MRSRASDAKPQPSPSSVVQGLDFTAPTIFANTMPPALLSIPRRPTYRLAQRRHGVPISGISAHHIIPRLPAQRLQKRLHLPSGHISVKPPPQPKPIRWTRLSSPSSPRIPQAFFHVTRAQFAILKFSHHIAHISNETPRSLLRTASNITSTLSPTFSTDSFNAKAKALADS